LNFKTLTTIPSLHQRTFPSSSIDIILQSLWSLSPSFCLQSISTIRYKILWLKVEKYHLILIIGPHVNKYIFQAQYSLEMALKFVGLKDVASKLKFLLTMNEMEVKYEGNMIFYSTLIFFIWYFTVLLFSYTNILFNIE
jgi:hypothetical protein